MRRLDPRIAALLVVAGLAVSSCRFDLAGLEPLPADAAGHGDAAAPADAPAGDAPVPADAPAGDGPAPADAPAEDAPAQADRLDAAGSDAGDASSCASPCTSCQGDGTCQIDCGAGECGSGVTCPAGRPCIVNCLGAQACETGLVDCSLATRCEINCVGTDACDNGVLCGGSECRVTCTGQAACEDQGVDCQAAACTIACNGPSACRDHVCCNGGDCAGACTSSSGGCCSCSGC
ncbi:MAG: hypothetical protein HY906_11765 [Deltaproteobacteria bacterium]|nr:hypothetical protein [Deltaproteobacteria bacterium]